MAHMLPVTAGQNRPPIPTFVLVEANNWLLHGYSAPADCRTAASFCPPSITTGTSFPSISVVQAQFVFVQIDVLLWAHAQSMGLISNLE
jgi:hypothetical protein